MFFAAAWGPSVADDNNPSPEGSSQRDSFALGLMGVAALIAIGGFGTFFSLWWQSSISDSYEILRIASQEFVKGHTVVAGELASRVEFEEPSDALDSPGSVGANAATATAETPEAETPELEAARREREEREEWIRLRDFLVGMGKVAKAEMEPELRMRRRHLMDALPFLERARDRGFPPGRNAEGYRVLGESYHRLGKFDDAIAALQQAMENDPTLRRTLLPKLAEAQLNSITPLEDQALATIDQYLNDPTLRDELRWMGELIRIRTMIEMGRWEEAAKVVQSELAKPKTQDIDLRDQDADYRDHLRLLQAIAQIQRTIKRHGPKPREPYEDRSAATAELAGVVPRLIKLEREAAPKIASRSRLWAARALLVQGRTNDALTQLTSVRQTRPFDGVAIIGGLEETELLASQGRGEETLQTTTYMMRELGDPSGFDASMVQFDEFQRRMGVVLSELRRNGEFEHAIDTARRLPPVFEVAESLIQEGIAYREWAAKTLSDGTDIGGHVARSASVLARKRFRAAGDAFARAAEIQFDSEEYLPTQWSAIDAYQRGRHFTKSIRLLEPYLRYEQRSRQPRGLKALGRALLAEDRPEDAIDSLTTCIVEFPTDPLSYDCRLLAALAYAEMGDLDNARTLLLSNLQDGTLTPQSETWRDSLLALGEMLYQHAYRNFLVADQAKAEDKVPLLRDNQPMLEEAIRYLDEAVERYFFESPRAESAAYLAAKANVMAAVWPALEAESTEIPGTQRRLRSRADQALQTALAGFIRLREHLMVSEEDQRLPKGGAAMIRNCYFAQADVLKQMGKLEEAANVYRAIELRYLNEPPALEAILGRGSCLRLLGRTREADLQIRQAAVVLQRIPPEWNDRFIESTRYDREGWEDLIGWMNNQLRPGT